MKHKIVILLMLLSLLLTGCFFSTKATYTFRQSFDQIEKIEILKKEYDSIRIDTPMNVIKELNPEEWQIIVDKLLSADGSIRRWEPGTGFGFYIIRISYKNGEAEMIGAYNNGYILPNGKIIQDFYVFDYVQFHRILSEILGQEITDVPGLAE